MSLNKNDFFLLIAIIFAFYTSLTEEDTSKNRFDIVEYIVFIFIF